MNKHTDWAVNTALLAAGALLAGAFLMVQQHRLDEMTRLSDEWSRRAAYLELRMYDVKKALDYQDTDVATLERCLKDARRVVAEVLAGQTLEEYLELDVDKETEVTNE